MKVTTRWPGFLWLVSLSLIGLVTGCRVSAPTETLDAGYYSVRRSPEAGLLHKRVYLTDSQDSMQLILPHTDGRRQITGKASADWTFAQTEVDIDVFTLPFKIRPAKGALPPQLNSNFNAAVYLGRRLDFHRYGYRSVTPSFGTRTLKSQGFGYGLFMGIGSATINDLVTSSQIPYEYEGVVINAGVATIFDAHIFNVGLAIGVDSLMDSNRRSWLYQHRPWFGVLFGLNLN
ncbi:MULTISPECIES: hypothetical protein [Spirosoma]|uniref:Lipoprotein n=1 Tax=Spirosoma sordidisoli TaxID=2502893 RepID=A0A4Q2UM36_9BACT|nr:MULTISPECIES: hypothetical protein [Spirosoma]RYC68781.1 hypothetical protein EQG79_15255 [Spirosoma sordidisoli]